MIYLENIHRELDNLNMSHYFMRDSSFRKGGTLEELARIAQPGERVFSATFGNVLYKGVKYRNAFILITDCSILGIEVSPWKLHFKQIFLDFHLNQYRNVAISCKPNNSVITFRCLDNNILELSKLTTKAANFLYDDIVMCNKHYKENHKILYPEKKVELELNLSKISN